MEEAAADSLRLWSWFFLVLYVAVLVALGAIGMRRIKGADDFATARGSYGPVLLAFAVTAGTASGATFLGLPGLAYAGGLPSIWYMVLYPLGVYTGILICLKVVSRAGAEFGSRSIPEYLGDRYQSDFLRVATAVFSLLLLIYIAGQLVAGLVMFELMLGLSEAWALAITVVVLVVYVVLGGAHADILTDASQGVVMLAIAIGIAFMAWVGYGVGTGFSDVVAKLDALDPNTTGMLNATHPLFDSWWDNVAVFIAHIPLGMLPHIGNKLWALNDAGSRKRFVTLLFALGLALPLVTLGGLLARAVLGDALFAEGATNNEAIPALFIALFSPWLAALLGIAILAAVMSTADGLVVSSSQIFANDIYRRTIAPRWHPHLTDSELDQRVLSISRWATIFVLAASAILAWQQLDTNVALIVWIGLGGMMAAIAGPVVLGALWKGVTRAGALAGFFGGATVFIFTKAALLPDWGVIAHWVNAQASNPYSCAALGVIAGVALTWLVSLFSEPLPDEHLAKVFGTSV